MDRDTRRRAPAAAGRRVSRAAPAERRAGLRRLLAEAVLAETRGLVEIVGRDAWGEVPAVLARRRAGLAALERALHDSGPEARAAGGSALAALRAAVLESERLMTWLSPREHGRPH